MSSTTQPSPDIFAASGRGLQHTGLRRANERAVLTIIAFNPGVSNADIARLSGLAPQTVSAILGDIDQAGLIERGAVLRGRRGQPATPITLRAEGAFSIGVQIGWDHVDVLLLNLWGAVVSKRRRRYDYPDARTLLADIADMTDDLIVPLGTDERARLSDMGVAIPAGLADNVAVMGAPAEQQALWNAVDIASELTRRTGLEASVFNDGNAASWAELIAFPKPRPASFIYFQISRHVAAGIVGEGTVWEGPAGTSANLGSMLVSGADGQLRSVHSIASTSELSRRLNAAGLSVDIADVDGWDWTGFGPVLEQWIDDSAATLARVVFNTTTVIESRLVVIDGVCPRDIMERLVERVRVQLAQLPVALYAPPQVLAGHLGMLAPAIGAAELTLYRRFFSRALANLAG